MKKLWRMLVGKGEKGQGIVEYGLIIGLIAVIIVAIFIALGPQIKKLFEGAVSSEQVTSPASPVESEMEKKE